MVKALAKFKTFRFVGKSGEAVKEPPEAHVLLHPREAFFNRHLTV